MEIKSNHVVKIIVSILVIAVLSFIFYRIFVEFIGPRLNDNFAEKQLQVLSESILSNSIIVVDSSKYAGCPNIGDDFIIRICFAVETELTISDFSKKIRDISGFEDAVIVAYSLEVANQWRFNGVQKDVEGMETDNYYLIGKTIKPQTFFDKRNK